MKRHPALQSLSRDHHQSLRLAARIKRIADKGSTEEITALGTELRSHFRSDWEPHFSIEERYLLKPLAGRDAALDELSKEIWQQHRTMLHMADTLAGSDRWILAELGRLLHDHTRLEERQLFPAAEKYLTEQELQQLSDIPAADVFCPDKD